MYSFSLHHTLLLLFPPTHHMMCTSNETITPRRSNKADEEIDERRTIIDPIKLRYIGVQTVVVHYLERASVAVHGGARLMFGAP